jgi:glycine oxidase
MRGADLFTPEDWRIEPRVALAAMRERFLQLGGRWSPEAVSEPPLASEVTILACGYGARHLAPELAVLAPIRGQLLRFAEGPGEGPVLRSDAGYLAPGSSGAVVGATMDAGRVDLDPDPVATHALLEVAERLCPGLGATPFRAEVGVRAATPDGWPLVGPSSASGIWLAAGARRNGWLLAPLVAELIADGLAGRVRTETAALFASDRFRSARRGGT